LFPPSYFKPYTMPAEGGF